MRNFSSLINYTIDSTVYSDFIENSIRLTKLQNGYNYVNLSTPLFVPKGSYLIIKDNAMALAVDKNVTASDVTYYQMNLTGDPTTGIRGSPCYLTKPNWNYYVRVAYQPSTKPGGFYFF